MTIPITPETKVGALLEAYPTLEARLIELAPAFEKLKNPMLRRTVAKLATLGQAARVAGLEPPELVRALREAAGLDPLGDGGSGATEGAEESAWIEALPVVLRLDADGLLAAGSHPLQAVSSRLTALGDDEAIVVASSFVPAPLVDAVVARGFACRIRTVNERTETWIARRRSGEQPARGASSEAKSQKRER